MGRRFGGRKRTVRMQYVYGRHKALPRVGQMRRPPARRWHGVATGGQKGRGAGLRRAAHELTQCGTKLPFAAV